MPQYLGKPLQQEWVEQHSYQLQTSSYQVMSQSSTGVAACFRGVATDSACAADAVLSGYFRGKRYAEQVLSETFPDGGVALRPGFIHGTRRVGSIGIPLSAVGEHRVPGMQHHTSCFRVS